MRFFILRGLKTVFVGLLVGVGITFATAKVDAASKYVVPSDVGSTISACATATYPTKIYTGPTKLTSQTTIENVLVNGCFTQSAR